MTKGGQELFLRMISKGLYRVDTEQGCVYSYRKERDSWLPLLGAVLPSGYRQIELYTGGDLRPKIRVYEHVAVWLWAYGEFPAEGKITHKDGDRLNNKWWNLQMNIKQVKASLLPAPENSRITEEQKEAVSKLIMSGIKSPTEIGNILLIDRHKVKRAMARMDLI